MLQLLIYATTELFDYLDHQEPKQKTCSRQEIYSMHLSDCVRLFMAGEREGIACHIRFPWEWTSVHSSSFSSCTRTRTRPQ